MNVINVMNVIDKIPKQQDVKFVIDQTTEQQNHKLSIDVIKDVIINVIERTTDIVRTTEMNVMHCNKDAKTSKSNNSQNAKVNKVSEQSLGHGLCPQPSDTSLNSREGFKTTENNSRAIPKQQIHSHAPNQKQKQNSGIT